MTKATVYFSRELTPETVVRLYEKLGIELPGKVAVKDMATGEQKTVAAEELVSIIDN